MSTSPFKSYNSNQALAYAGYNPFIASPGFVSLQRSAWPRQQFGPATPRKDDVFVLSQNSPNHKSSKFLGERSKGMWLFDALLYPLLTNAAVFAISVLATYATTYGGPKNFMRLRGDWARQQMQKLFKMSPTAAKETIMITFSFLDGCIMAPVIKLFEDHRIDIVKSFDRWMGTTPQDPNAYAEEPRQSWLSVLGGRATALAMVLPTAKLLSTKLRGGYSINQLFFAKPGNRIGQWVKNTWPGLQKTFPRLNIPGLAEVCAMEAFYTSLCTLGLYVSSRFYALHNKTQTVPGTSGNSSIQ